MKKIAFQLVVFTAILLVASPVNANLKGSIYGNLDDAAVETYQVNVEESDDASDLISRVSKVANMAIGALGIAAVVLIIYAGFIWMKAGGEKGEIEKAQKIIKRVVVGVVIIAFAYFIVSFVVRGLSNEDELAISAITTNKLI